MRMGSGAGAGGGGGGGGGATGAGAGSSRYTFSLAATVLAGFLPPRMRRERAGRLAGEDSEESSGLLLSSADLGGTDMRAGFGPGGVGFQEAISQGIDLFSEKFG